MTIQEDIINTFADNRAVFDAAMQKHYGKRYTDYRTAYEEIGRFAYVPDFPLYIMLEQTFSCNLHCPSCIQGIGPLKEKYIQSVVPMPFPLFTKIIDEAAQYHCPSLAFHVNDEPLLVNDLAVRIAYARDKGIMDLFMTTNGILLTEERMIALIDAGITRILFSLDAATEETYNAVRPGGDFTTVLKHLKAVAQYKKEKGLIVPAVRASFVTTKLNEHETKLFVDTISPFVDFVDVQGFSYCYDFNKELIPSQGEAVHDFRCSEPWRKLIIRANGDVLPCCSFYGYDMVLGNVNDTTLYDIFHDAQCSALRDEVKKGIYKNNCCATCATSLYSVK